VGHSDLTSPEWVDNLDSHWPRLKRLLIRPSAIIASNGRAEILEFGLGFGFGLLALLVSALILSEAAFGELLMCYYR